LICINFIDSTLYGVNTSKEKLKYERKSACDNFIASVNFLKIIYSIICQDKMRFRISLLRDVGWRKWSSILLKLVTRFEKGQVGVD